MTEVLEKKRLRLVSHCHLPQLWVTVPPIEVSPELFPAAQEGFEGYSVVTRAGWFASTYMLVDMSGLTLDEVRVCAKATPSLSDRRVGLARYLQCLDWVHKGDYRDKFDYARIAAYIDGGEPMGAEPCEGGFRRIRYEGDDVPWPEGTLGLFGINEL